jgi:hypothetical protein
VLALLQAWSAVYYQNRPHENWLEISSHIEKYCGEEQPLGLIFVDPNSQTAIPYYLPPACNKDVLPYRITAAAYLNRPDLKETLHVTAEYPRVIVIERRSSSQIETLAEVYRSEIQDSYEHCEETFGGGKIRILECIQRSSEISDSIVENYRDLQIK